MIRVVVADDQQEVRDGLAMMISAESDMHLLGLAADGAEAVDLARRDRPDVIVMDVRMPGVDGIEATRRITEDHQDDPDSVTAVLVITTFDNDEALYGALQAGASGYMLKQAAPSGLAEAVRAVADGGAWIDPMVAPKVIDRLRDRTPVDSTGRPTLENLSRREIEVLKLMADAPTNTDLARILFVSESTVKTHISRLLMKTGSHDRAQLVALAYRSGLVRP
ncbi:response regulator transcription factor [Ornithinimicrobium humiphilum]|uniref:LuxR family two component transcriptional regulator n=1 Tax=Ornithinimicrobium humiphilum TaxID=125288 RepID=A0A543K897_9MICO|nr:response regulator transcription factor [Ornithinimicrobium humiphilum]TQM91295.1 LuxR family two component transcriptional regulator [Ornithinimicrobium humiphilum]